MTPKEATEIVKQCFDIGESEFFFSKTYGETCLSIDLADRTLHLDRYLCKTPESLLHYFKLAKERIITFSHREAS